MPHRSSSASTTDGVLRQWKTPQWRPFPVRSPKLIFENEKASQLSLIRVKSCKLCGEKFLMGDSPWSPYYKPCSCGGSDLTRKAYQEQAQLNQVPAPVPEKTINEAFSISKSALTQKSQTVWNGFHTRSSFSSWKSYSRCADYFRRVTEHSGFGILGFGQKYATPKTQNSFSAPYKLQIFQKRWAQRLRRLSTSLTSKSFAETTEASPNAGSHRILEMEFPRRRQSRKASNSQSTFEYKNEAFDPLPECSIRKESQDTSDEIDSMTSNSKRDDISHQFNFQDNFTIGSASSVVVSLLSHASFAFFVLWITLYVSTLGSILPEMKYLHKYLTVCSLVILTTLNSFRFYISLRADKDQNAYLFTGSKTLTAFVIAALASLLVSDIYSERPRPFNIIISSIFMCLLVAEGGALVYHHQFLYTTTVRERSGT